MDFQEADRRYAEIKRRHDSSDLTQEEFDEQLKELMVQDEEGRWWVKSRTTGDWHFHDGTAWVKSTPPSYQAPQTAPEDQPRIQQDEATATGGSGQRDTEAARAEPPPSDKEAKQLADTQPHSLVRSLAAIWWALALRGSVVVVIGLALFSLNISEALPRRFYASLYSVLVITDGVFIVIASRTHSSDLRSVIQGIISGSAGLTLLLSALMENYDITDYAIALWAICLGIIHTIVATRLGWEFKIMKLMLIVSGVLLGLFGGFLLMLQVWGLPFTRWLWAICLLVSGVSLMAFAFWVRNWEANGARPQRTA